MRAALLLLLATGLVHLAAAAAGDYETLFDHGPSGNRWDITILGDGYTATQQTRLHQHADKWAAAFPLAREQARPALILLHLESSALDFRDRCLAVTLGIRCHSDRVGIETDFRTHPAPLLTAFIKPGDSGRRARSSVVRAADS